MKKITLYLILKTVAAATTADSINTTTLPEDAVLTIVANKKEATEYVLRRICFEHITHFEPWCELHNLDRSALDTCKTYVATCCQESEIAEYKTLKTVYTASQVATLFRVAYSCTPVGASYEPSLEIENFLYRTTFLQNLNNNLEEQ